MRSAECGISRGGRSQRDAYIDIPHSAFRTPHWGEGWMLSIDLKGKRALVAGLADDGGYGFAIAKALAEAGATVCTGTWPPALNIFLNLLERGKIDESRRMPDGALLQFEKIYPLDAAFDTLAEAPEEIRGNKRYKDVGDFSIAGLAQRLEQDFGDRPLDIVIHSLANGPEVKKPLLDTSRAGYLGTLGEREITRLNSSDVVGSFAGFRLTIQTLA